MSQIAKYTLNESKSPEIRKNQWISLDIIIPVYNEEEVLDLLFRRLESIFSSSNQKKYLIKAIRYIIVDDGSKDSSAQIISRYIARGIPAVLYRFSRNFGHQNAVSAGIENSEADVVAIIDADLQDPPEVILQMIGKWRQGYDVIHGERKKRKENFIKVASYWVFYRLLSLLAEINIPHDCGDFSLLDRRVVESIRSLPEKLRYPRVLRTWVGFRQTKLKYERSARKAGRTKYPFFKLYKLATESIASASIRPLRISQVFSICYLVLVIALGFIIIIRSSYYLEINDITALRFLFCYALIALGSFVQTVCIYVLSSYVGRAYLETKGRPTYIVMEVINKDVFSGASSLDEK